MICPTIPKVEYCVTTSVSGYVTDGLSGKVLCTLTPHVQSRFVAISSTVQIPDEGVIFTGHVRPYINTTHEEAPDVWEAGAPISITKGATYRISDNGHSVTLLPRGNEGLCEISLLYTPSEARTTPLITVPDGVTLHWAGDEEPTWESGKDYVIQILQTSPTRIEARLFNAPQGAKLPQGVNLPQGMTQEMLDNFEGIIYDNETHLPVYAQLDTQTNGNHQFRGRTSDASVFNVYNNIVFATATFAAETTGVSQFNTVIPWSQNLLMLPEATFSSLTDGEEMFSRQSVMLPKANFKNLTNAKGMFGSSTPWQDFSLPLATFDNVTNAYNMFACVSGYNPRGGLSMPLATLKKAETAYRIFAGHFDLFTPELTFERVSDCEQGFYNGSFVEGGFPKKLNLKSLSKGTGMFYVLAGNELSAEQIQVIVYGPKINTQGEIDLEHGNHVVSSMKPTGWGIKDYRNVDEAGDFVTPYSYPAGTHTLGLRTPHGAADKSVEDGGSAASGEIYAAALHELHLRGWTVTFA